MNIKYMLGVLVIILFIGNIFCIYEMNFSNQFGDNNVIIGDKSIKLPKNFSSTEVDISNGTDSMTISKFNSNNIDSLINDYKNKSSDNFTIVVSEFDSKLPAKKTVAKTDGGSSFVKYWFNQDDNIYQIQFFNQNNKNYDDIARDMINSIS